MSAIVDEVGSGEGLLDGIGTGGKLIFLGTATTVVSLVLPWLTATAASGVVPGSGSFSGIAMITAARQFSLSPAGTISLAGGATLLTLYRRDSERARLIEASIGSSLLLIGLLVVVTPASVLSDTDAAAGSALSPGLGAFATLAAGLLVTVGGLYGYLR